VDAAADLDPEIADRLHHGAGTANGLGGAVERRQEPVSGRVHLSTPKALELDTDQAVMSPQQLAPPAVSELRCDVGRAHDVGEEHGQEGRGTPLASHDSSVRPAGEPRQGFDA
jgi:hypothetical protein